MLPTMLPRVRVVTMPDLDTCTADEAIAVWTAWRQGFKGKVGKWDQLSYSKNTVRLVDQRFDRKGDSRPMQSVVGQFDMRRVKEEVLAATEPLIDVPEGEDAVPAQWAAVYLTNGGRCQLGVPVLDRQAGLNALAEMRARSLVFEGTGAEEVKVLRRMAAALCGGVWAMGAIVQHVSEWIGAIIYLSNTIDGEDWGRTEEGFEIAVTSRLNLSELTSNANHHQRSNTGNIRLRQMLPAEKDELGYDNWLSHAVACKRVEDGADPTTGDASVRFEIPTESLRRYWAKQCCVLVCKAYAGHRTPMDGCSLYGPQALFRDAQRVCTGRYDYLEGVSIFNVSARDTGATLLELLAKATPGGTYEGDKSLIWACSNPDCGCPFSRQTTRHCRRCCDAQSTDRKINMDFEPDLLPLPRVRVVGNTTTGFAYITYLRVTAKRNRATNLVYIACQPFDTKTHPHLYVGRFQDLHLAVRQRNAVLALIWGEGMVRQVAAQEPGSATAPPELYTVTAEDLAAAALLVGHKPGVRETMKRYGQLHLLEEAEQLQNST